MTLALSPPDLLRDLSMNRVVPGRFGPHILVGSNTIERVDVHDRLFGRVSTGELVTRLFVHSRATYSSSPVIVPLTIELRRFPDPLQARIALLEMMVREQDVRSVSNPIKGHIYSSHGWPVVYRWVDGVWLGRLEAYNRDFMSLLVSWVPYVETEDDSAAFAPDRPHEPSQPFLLPALFLVAAAGVWPITASRVLKVRPRRNVKRLHVDGLIANLDALNEESRNWKITRAGTTDFVAEWRVTDRSWQGLYGRAGLSRSKSLRLRLQASSATVKAVEQRIRGGCRGKMERRCSRINRQAPIVLRGPTRMAEVAGRRRLGIPAVRSRERLSASYDVSMMKRTIAEIVLSAGWSYQPVILMGWS